MLPLLVGLLALASATDSIATPMPTTSQPDTRALFEPGSWGVGFRVYGTGASLRIDRALAPRIALGLRASWSGDYSASTTTSESQSEYSAARPDSKSEATFASVKLDLPVQWIMARRGDLRLAADLGPTWFIRFSQNQHEYESFGRGESTTQVFGATAGLGIAWEFVPGLFLASGFGADATYEFSSSKSRGESSYDWQRQSGETEEWSTYSWFGGIGLDAWF